MDRNLLDQLIPLCDPTALPRVLGRPDALRRGYTPDAIKHRLATKRWQRILPRTYLTTDTLTWPDQLSAALTFAGEQAVLSGAAALADTGLRSVRRPSSVLVLVPREVTARSHGWVRIRRTNRLPVRRLAPGPARAPDARAVADLALELSELDDVRALVAEVVRRGRCDTAELTDELTSRPRRGSAHFRQALAEIGVGAWSAPEARAATLLRRAHVPTFEQNAVIDLPGGRRFVADFLWRRLRAVLEIDSVEHHVAPADLDATMARHLLLETLGYSVIHPSPAVIRRTPGVFVREVSTWLAARSEAMSA